MRAHRPIAILISGLAFLPAPGHARNCFAIAEPIPADGYIGPAQVAVVACREQAVAPAVSYDRGVRALHADAPLAKGEYLGPLVIDDAQIAAPGEEMVLVFTKGPVTVERQVAPLSATSAGRTGLFRAEDGTVFAATFMPEQSDE